MDIAICYHTLTASMNQRGLRLIYPTVQFCGDRHNLHTTQPMHNGHFVKIMKVFLAVAVVATTWSPQNLQFQYF